jgi:hypothetical protein
VAQASAQHGEVLRECEGGAAVDQAVSADDAVARDPLLVHTEVVAAVNPELVDLDEAARVEEQIDPLADRELPALVLPGNPFGSPHLEVATTAFPQLADPGLEVLCHSGNYRFRRERPENRVQEASQHVNSRSGLLSSNRRWEVGRVPSPCPGCSLV